MNSRSHQDTLTSVGAKVNDVAFALYRELSTRGNLIFSPLSIYCALRMLLAGAQGETRRALSALLQEQLPTATPAPLRVLLDELASYTLLKGNRRTKSANAMQLRLSIASGLWVQEGVVCNPRFRITAAVDFKHRPVESCAAINAWVAKQTHGLIPEMLSPENITPLTRAILGNALYFKARWQNEFLSSEPGVFFLLDRTGVQVPMMHEEFSGLRHVHRDDFWSVELPYDENPLAMVLIVPARPGEEALAGLERQLARRWDAMMPDKPGPRYDVRLTMPQFNVRGSYPLNGVLRHLGLDAIFSPEANFSTISKDPGFGIDQILHDAYLAVDQRGTEAGAATIIETMGGAEQPINLTIDRPFLFAVRDQRSGVILFLGKVENPA